jgi:hypothetical protein
VLLALAIGTKTGDFDSFLFDLESKRSSTLFKYGMNRGRVQLRGCAATSTDEEAALMRMFRVRATDKCVQ